MNRFSTSHAYKEAFKITNILDTVFGVDRFDKSPISIIDLATEYSAEIAPKSPIHSVLEKDISGCMGALVYGDKRPRQWGILYHKDQSFGRRNFTIAHEFGHFLLHRDLIEKENQYDGGIYCNENNILLRNGTGIEREADIFAANLMMPLNDFRKMLPAKSRPNFEILRKISKRYGVSLTATILRWLEYTETRALLLVSNEGFAHWAKASKPALKSGRFIKTRNHVYQLPNSATAVTKNYCDETAMGINQAADVWFPEPVQEMCIRIERYDIEMTLLHLPKLEIEYKGEEVDSLMENTDTFKI